jgi:hypothetical protein
MACQSRIRYVLKLLKYCVYSSQNFTNPNLFAYVQGEIYPMQQHVRRLHVDETFLTAFVNPQLRPRPPRDLLAIPLYALVSAGEHVDAFVDDAWCEGIVKKDSLPGVDAVEVFLPEGNQAVQFSKSAKTVNFSAFWMGEKKRWVLAKEYYSSFKNAPLVLVDLDENDESAPAADKPTTTEVAVKEAATAEEVQQAANAESAKRTR